MISLAGMDAVIDEHIAIKDVAFVLKLSLALSGVKL